MGEKGLNIGGLLVLLNMAECKRCGYKWVYSGKMVSANCPSCHYSVKIEGREKYGQEIKEKEVL